jgi:hypothetical protein
VGLDSARVSDDGVRRCGGAAIGGNMIAHSRIGIIGTIGIVVAGAALLSGCAAPVAAEPDPDAVAAEHEKPDAGWCEEYAGTFSHWGPAAYEIDEARFDEVIGLDFIGPADCYLEVLSDSGTAKSVVAVFMGEDPAIATFLNTRLTSQGWTGSIADPLKGGVLSHPEIGDLGYSFAEAAKEKSIPVEGPAIVVTLLLGA